jgi:serine protease Do
MFNPRTIASFALGAVIAAAIPLGAASRAVPIEDKKIEEIIKSVAPSVVRVEARNGVRKVATGVVIDKDGSIITTALISPRDEVITVHLFDGRTFTAAFKGFDTQSGLAVIQVKDKGLTPIALGKSSDLRTGAWVGAIGFSPEKTPTVTQGIVSSVSDDRARLNLWVMPGSSGSPVVNAEGQMTGVLRGSYVDDLPVVFEFREQQVVGSGTVVSRASAPSSGMALAVPVDVVLSIAGDIIKSGKVLRGWIGVQVLETEDRLEIEAIDPKSPAESAKLKVGDRLVKIDGKDVSSGVSFSQEIRKRKPGTEINLGIVRDDAAKEIKVKLGEYSEEEGRRELETLFPELFLSFQARPADPKAQPQLRIRRPQDFFPMESRKYIGLSVQPLTPDLAVFFGVKEGTGLLVVQFDKDSPAQKAGLKIGDVILKADGRAVEIANEISLLLQRKNKGDNIRFDILRDKKALVVEVPIAGQNEPGPEERAAQDVYGPGASDFHDQMKQFFQEYSQAAREGSEKKDALFNASGIFYRI